MIAVFQPARAIAVESGPPDWPAPITIASYSVIALFLLSVVLLSLDYLVLAIPASLHIKTPYNENSLSEIVYYYLKENMIRYATGWRYWWNQDKSGCFLT